jgi:protein CpxP
MKRGLLVLLLAVPLIAQQQTQPGMPMERGQMRVRTGGPAGEMMPRMRGPGMEGKWWTNTDLAKKLNLTDQQVQQMEQTYQQNRLKLIDEVAAVQKQEVILEPMLSADRPDEAQVLAQIDKIAQARAELEKSHARMLLGIRQVLSAEQWKQLKAQMPPQGPMRHMGPEGSGAPGMRQRRSGPDGTPTPPPPPEE